MDFRKIEYFLKVAETLNFSEAAKELFISPQALTQQISLLEGSLGSPLFVRTTRKVELTEFGAFCYARFAPVKSAFDEAAAAVIRKRDTVRIGFFNGLPKHEIVYPWLELVKQPQIDASLEIASHELGALWNGLIDGSLDICLTMVDSYKDISRCKSKAVLTVPARIVVSTRHPWASGSAVDADDMAHADMVQLVTSEPPQVNFYSSVRCSNISYVRDFDSMLAMLEGGAHFAVFPPIFEFRERAKYRYFDLPPELAFNCMVICMCIKENKKRGVQEIMDNINANY